MTEKKFKTFDVEFYGGVFTGFKNFPYYLVKDGEPIPIKLLRKTKVSLGPPRPRKHPITGDLINYGQVPFGYRGVNGTLHIDPFEQFVLQHIRQMHKDGANLGQIARYLTESGIPTKNGGKWQRNTVNKILTRE